MDFHGRGIDAPQLVAAKLTKDWRPVPGDDNSVRHGVSCGYFLQINFSALGIQPSDKIAVLNREPENSILIKNWSMRVLGAWIRQVVLLDLAGRRIQLADISLKHGGEPDMSILVCHQPMRAGLGHLQRIFLNCTRFRIKASQLVCHLACVPQGAVRSSCRIMRT